MKKEHSEILKKIEEDLDSMFFLGKKDDVIFTKITNNPSLVVYLISSIMEESEQTICPLILGAVSAFLYKKHLDNPWCPFETLVDDYLTMIRNATLGAAASVPKNIPPTNYN